nr:hypothetical protein [Tanacetum cinerariifolium]
MVNVNPPNHVDDVPVVEPDQHDDVLIVPEPVLVDEDEDPEEDEFKEGEYPQEKENDMELDIKEYRNEPELTYLYKEIDPLNPLSPAFESEPKDTIEVENPIEHEYKTVPTSVMRWDIDSIFGQMAFLLRRLCGHETAHALVEKKGKAKDKFYGKLILDLGNKVRSSVEQGTAAMEKLVEKLGNAEDKVVCNKLKNELKEARGSMFKERPNEAINVSMKMRRVHNLSRDDLLIMLSSLDSLVVPLLQVNVRNKASGSGPVRGQDVIPATREFTFAGFMKCNPTAFCGTEGVVELLRWFEKTESVFGISECVEGKKVRFAIVTLQGPNLTWWNAKIATRGFETMNQMPWTKMKHLMTAEFCPIEEIQRMEHELWNLKVKEYNIVAYTQMFNELELMPANLNEAVRMAHKLMDQKAQARDERILEEKSESEGAFKMEIVVTRAIKGITHCTIKCHKCGKVGQKSRYYKEKNVATSANALPIPTCYYCGKQGHTRNRCPRKVKQEEVVEVRGRAYAIKDAEPKGLSVVTSTFLLNNRYAFVFLFGFR